MSKILLQLANESNAEGLEYDEKGEEIYIHLPEDDRLNAVVHGARVVVPRRWVDDNDVVEIPSEKTELYLRHEFFSDGKWRLKQEDFIPAKALIHLSKA